MATHSRFEIPEKLPSLNEVINKNRGNRYAAANMKKELEAMICLYIRDAVRKGALSVVTKPCYVKFTWYERTKRRDVDNIQSSQKFVLDALQKSGVLQNDSRKWVRQIIHEVVDADHDGVLVELIEEEKHEQERFI